MPDFHVRNGQRRASVDERHKPKQGPASAAVDGVMGNRLLDLRARPLKTPEGPRFLLGRKGDFKTDFPVAGDFECGGLEFLVIEPYAQTAHRIGVADFERLRDEHCGGCSGAESHHGNLSGWSVFMPFLDRPRDNVCLDFG